MDGGAVVFYGSIETQYTWHFLKSIKFKVKNERPLGIAHVDLFTF